MIFEIKKPKDIIIEVREAYEPNSSESIPYIGLEHINQETLTLKGVGSSSNTQSTKRKFKKGDVLFGTLRPYFRKVISARFDGVCSTDIAVLRARYEQDNRYIQFFIASKKFIDFSSAHSSGTRMPRTNWNKLSETEWPIPRIEVRMKIASILSAYDDLIENNTRRIAILEEMAQRIYKEWFVDFKYPGHENDTLVDSELGMIPEGWEVQAIGDICKRVQSGGTPSRKNETYWNNGHIDWYKTGELQD